MWVLRCAGCGRTLSLIYQIYAGAFWPKHPGNDVVHVFDFEKEHSLKLECCSEIEQLYFSVRKVIFQWE